MIDFNLDHFKIYEVDPPQRVSEKVLLQGQFDRKPIAAELMVLKYFANPVDKEWENNQVQRHNPNAHLTWYQLYQSSLEPTRTVIIDNQFGRQEFLIGNPLALLVPAWKSRTGEPFEDFQDVEFPQDLDHFKLYKVLEGKPLNIDVRLKDQFNDEFGDDPEHVMVTCPRAFGVPVSKRRLKREEEFDPIRNEQAHLVIYSITPLDVPRYPSRLIRDQIITPNDYQRPYSITFVRGVKLAVPSEKIDVK
ncbi:MAG: hypothetical protein QNJ60_03410 [Xenococcaceae cyanobacterium MO_188.B19]|nr:hypothetical protein [Xenococcaceae cyanobacterium MO_188.B19]